MAQGVAAIGVLIGAIGAFAAGVAYISQTVTRDRLSESRRETAGILGLWAVSLLLIFVSGVVVPRPVESGSSEQQYIEALALAVPLVTLQYLSVSITFEWRFDQWSDAIRLTLRKTVILSGMLTGLGAALFVNPPVTQRRAGADIYGLAAIGASFLLAVVASLRYSLQEMATQDAPTPASPSVEQRETVVSKPENDDDEPFAGTGFEPAETSSEESRDENSRGSAGSDTDE
jgi:hypothetical protein